MSDNGGGALAVREANTPMPSGQQMEVIWRTAKAAVQSGLLPEGIKTQEQAFWVMYTGFDLGIGLSTAVRSIHVIKGRPTYSADLLAALAYRGVPGVKIQPVVISATRCAFEAWRPGWSAPVLVEWTIEDAKRAGLAGKDTYIRQPRQMLSARAKAEAARLVAPEAIANMYAPEELVDLPAVVTDAPPSTGMLNLASARSASPAPPPPEPQKAPRPDPATMTEQERGAYDAQKQAEAAERRRQGIEKRKATLAAQAAAMKAEAPATAQPVHDDDKEPPAEWEPGAEG